MESSFIPPTFLLRLKIATSTPNRLIACASSSPMAPVPTTAIDFGKSDNSKIVSEVISVSPRDSFQPSGTEGLEPVATMIWSALIYSMSPVAVCASISPDSENTARPYILLFSSQLSTFFRAKLEKRSRSSWTRFMTCLPLIVAFPSIPNSSE